MSSVIAIIFLAFSTRFALADFFESEEIIPLRINERNSGRFWTRSEDRVSFRIAAFGKEFTLNLTPDESFLAPAIKIHRIRSNSLPKTLDFRADQEEILHPPGHRASDILRYINETDAVGTSLKGCFYSGTVDSKPDSVVAVSICYGIYGSFITDGDEYLIEPQTGSGRAESSQMQPHVVKKRVLAGTRRVQEIPIGRKEDEQRGQGAPILSGEMQASAVPREKRFVSAERYIETLVVADSTMARFYGDDLKHYLLTLVSMAAQVYKHPSLKNSVSLVVVKMLVVEDQEAGPSVSANGDLTLRNFCAWQQLFNPRSQRHPEHYDTAILVTRQDICGHHSCSTLGVADVGTMCDPKRSCFVVEDNGLQTGFTVAHELGVRVIAGFSHVLSMPHDDSRNCERKFGHLGGHHVMAPVFEDLSKALPWSPCSAYHVTEFFDAGHGDCLLDAPENSLPLPSEPPGLTYSLDRQCQQAFGETFRHCANVTDVDTCGQLWCQEAGRAQCATRKGGLPWADGTPCGTHASCLDGSCVEANWPKLRPQTTIDGSWGSWGPWGLCSRTCGGGVKFSHRECTDPEPRNGGRYCVGQRVKYQSCNTQACLESSGKSFREEQCERYNSLGQTDGSGNAKRWIPKYAGISPRDRCRLVCRARGSSEFRVFEAKVVDGTTCGLDTTSICVQGQCVKAGCDLVIGSSEKLDKCGVCGGDGSSCRKVTGSMNWAAYGYNDIVTIPAGATNIDVKQRSQRGMEHDGNYLAVMAGDGAYILNGNFSVSTVEQDVPVRGAFLRYSGSSTTLERIQSFHQLREVITVQLLSTAGEASPPRVKYSFFLPKGVSFSRAGEKRVSPHTIQPIGRSEWIMGEWSECSKTCGSGWSRRDVECRDERGLPTFVCDEGLRPVDIRPCSDLPCPVWQMGPWSSCSRNCRHGERRRAVFCTDYTGKTVEPERCDLAKKPTPVSAECAHQEC